MKIQRRCAARIVPQALRPLRLHAFRETERVVAFSLLWVLLKKPPWLLCAWLLHILCDIPTHAASYFPTPFLWPFPTPFVNGIPWTTPWFMAANYTAIALTYCVLFLYYRGAKTNGQKI